MVFIYYLHYYGDNIATKYYLSDPAGLCCATTKLINNIDVGGCLIAAWSRADRGPGPPDGPRGQDQAACVGSVQRWRVALEVSVRKLRLHLHTLEL